MDDWWLRDLNPGYDYPYPYCQDKTVPAHVPQAQYPSPTPTLTLLLSPDQRPCLKPPKGENPRELRNKAEKQRRDKLNQSISKLASMVPPVVKPGRKMDKTSILRLTAHYLRSHQYVFGDSIDQSKQFSAGFTQSLLKMLKGFLITTTYKGIIVVVSPNVHEYLGYTELELLGQNIFTIVHEEDHRLLREQLLPMTCMLGSNGELLLPDGPDSKQKVAELLANDKRHFMIRFKKLSHQRSQPVQYVTCHIEGSLRKSDKACSRTSRYCHVVRRVRSRGENHYPSGNDVVFIGLVRPTCESFLSECALESFRMEYRTRHSIDGEIIQSEQRIALVTGYMTHEVNGVNAMNFMHKDDVRWVIIALRQMYDQNQLMGESCYRLMTKNGEFIYMRTCGQLDVDPVTKAATSFVCTNTVVGEQEGEQLITLMKKKFNLTLNNEEDVTDGESTQDDQTLPITDPRLLQKVILRLVTNLPLPQSNLASQSTTEALCRFEIIPPRKERVLRAIKKSYSVIKTLQEFKKSMNTNIKNDGHDDLQPEVVWQRSTALDPSSSTTTVDSERQQLDNIEKIIDNIWRQNPSYTTTEQHSSSEEPSTESSSGPESIDEELIAPANKSTSYKRDTIFAENIAWSSSKKKRPPNIIIPPNRHTGKDLRLKRTREPSAENQMFGVFKRKCSLSDNQRSFPKDASTSQMEYKPSTSGKKRALSTCEASEKNPRTEDKEIKGSSCEGYEPTLALGDMDAVIENVLSSGFHDSSRLEFTFISDFPNFDDEEINDEIAQIMSKEEEKKDF